MATLGTTAFDSLIAGPQSKLVTDTVMIEKGQNLKRGSLLGRNINTNLFSLCDLNSTVGLNILCAILLEDINTTDGKNKLGLVYFEGDFNKEALITKQGETAEQYRWQGRLLGLYFRNIVENK